MQCVQVSLLSIFYDYYNYKLEYNNTEKQQTKQFETIPLKDEI